MPEHWRIPDGTVSLEPFDMPGDDDDGQAITRIYARAAALGEPTSTQLEQIKAHAQDPSVFDEAPPFVMTVEASNDKLDTYFTRMHRSTLDNFALDAQNGIAFMNSHRTGGIASDAELPYGRTFDARVAGPRGTGYQRVDESVYIPRGAMPNGPGRMSSDQLIDTIRTGTTRDVSVGFYGGEFRCSICDRDMARDWKCNHWPGFVYAKTNKDGDPTGEEEQAVVWIHNARQAEVSAVFDGATPGAMIKKATRMAEAGLILPQTIELMEARYRVNLPRTRRLFTGAETQEGKHMPEPKEETTREQEGTKEPTILVSRLTGLRQALKLADDAGVADIELTVRAQQDELTTLRAFSTDENRRLVDDGKAYRADLIEQAIVQGKRALGDNFAEETYRGILGTATLETVKRMGDDYKRIADAGLPKGRQSQDGEAEGTREQSRNRVVSDAAYRA